MSEEKRKPDEYLEPEETPVPDTAEEPVKKKKKFSLFNFIFKKPPFIRRFRRTKFFKFCA